MKTRKHKVNLITLGCSKNLVDSEVLMAQLKGNNIDVVHETAEEDFNIAIINTCGFIDRAKQESIDTILQFAGARKNGEIEKLYVTGCLSQRYKDDLRKEIPEVDDWFGTMDLPLLLKKFNADYKHELIGERKITTADHYAYLKVSEGCNRTCAFCAIPLMRGKHISRNMEDIIAEARGLVRNGVKEIMLIAQELTYYGLDIYRKRALPELLRKLSEVEGLEWIRLHYAYPSKFPLEVIEVMKERPNICNYLDIPLQHASDNVLKNMKRQITRKETEKLIGDIRDILPEITIRTTMLVGFPGETGSDFEELMNFTEKTEFDRLGVFTYSHEEGTSGYDLEDDVPAEIKEERAATLMELQQQISAKNNKNKVGQIFKVLFDRKEGSYFIGRTEADSPEVDNEVLVSASDHFIRIGDFADVKITAAEDFDLFGEVVNNQ